MRPPLGTVNSVGNTAYGPFEPDTADFRFVDGIDEEPPVFLSAAPRIEPRPIGRAESTIQAVAVYVFDSSEYSKFPSAAARRACSRISSVLPLPASANMTTRGAPEGHPKPANPWTGPIATQGPGRQFFIAPFKKPPVECDRRHGSTFLYLYPRLFQD